MHESTPPRMGNYPHHNPEFTRLLKTSKPRQCAEHLFPFERESFSELTNAVVCVDRAIFAIRNKPAWNSCSGLLGPCRAKLELSRGGPDTPAATTRLQSAFGMFAAPGSHRAVSAGAIEADVAISTKTDAKDAKGGTVTKRKMASFGVPAIAARSNTQWRLSCCTLSALRVFVVRFHSAQTCKRPHRPRRCGLLEF
jgi:hypothetical protein